MSRGEATADSAVIYQVVDDSEFENIASINKHMEKAVKKTLHSMGRKYKGKIINAINKSPRVHGRPYLNPYLNRHVRRSKPGNAHANESQALKKSLSWATNGVNGLQIGYGLKHWYGEAWLYAAVIEEGGEYVSPRPSIENNISDVDFESYFNSAIKETT